jgi:fibronectin type 3 domain-containing protein
MKNLSRKFCFVPFLAAMVLLTAGCSNGTTDDSTNENTDTTTKLPAPRNLTAVSVSTSQINLSWTPVDGASYYNIYRTTDSTWGNYRIVSASVLTTQYDDISLFPGTTYYYKVGAKKTYTNDPVGELSGAVSAATSGSSGNAGSERLSVPQNLTALAVSTSQIYLSWTPVDGANYYNVYRTTDSTWQNYSIISSFGSYTVYNDYSLSPGTTYYYKVGAKRNSSSVDPDSELSDVASAVTKTSNDMSGDLEAPDNLTATPHGRIITLEWDEVEGADSYQIYGSFASDGTFVYIGSVSYGTAFNVVSMTVYGSIPLEPDTTYYFKVRASEGQLSSGVSGKTDT